MIVTCGQSDEKLMISMTVDEVSRETALKLADSKYFDAAFNLADNRKSLRKACEQAKKFYREVRDCLVRRTQCDFSMFCTGTRSHRSRDSVSSCRDRGETKKKS